MSEIKQCQCPVPREIPRNLDGLLRWLQSKEVAK